VFKILITSVGGGLACHLYGAIKGGIHKNLKIIGVNNKDNIQARNFFDKFFVVPNPNKKKYIKTIVNIVKKNKINLLIPGSDEEALILSKNSNKFIRLNCTLACISYELLKVFNDKIKTYKALESKGLPVANYFEALNLNDLKSKITFFKKKDFVIKPALSRGGRDILVIKNKIKKIEKKNFGREIHMPKKVFISKFLNTKSIKFPAVIMDRLNYPVYDIDMLSFKGKPINVVPRKRLNPNEPNEGHKILNQKN